MKKKVYPYNFIVKKEIRNAPQLAKARVYPISREDYNLQVTPFTLGDGITPFHLGNTKSVFNVEETLTAI